MELFTEDEKNTLYNHSICFDHRISLVSLTQTAIYSLCRNIGIYMYSHFSELYSLPANQSLHLDDEEEIKSLISQISSKLDELRSFGVSSEQIRIMLSPYKKVSRLKVTDDNGIFLVDYSNIEIHLYPIQKAIYILFLHHPEGIILKNISEYHDELLVLYSRISQSKNTYRINKTINKICNPLSNSLYEVISSINKAFTSIFDELLAKHYIITGTQSSIYKIEISSNKDVNY